MFKRATNGFVQLVMFGDKPDTDAWGQPWPCIPITDREQLVDAAVRVATRAANADKRVVFCPPICGLVAPDGYRGFAEADLAAGVAISVDLDNVPSRAGTELLTEIIGCTPTTIVHTGGIYIDENGVEHDRVHLHWRLSRPAETDEDKAVLKECRNLAAYMLTFLHPEGTIGGDRSSVPVIHPLRWPGSYHRKAESRMAWGEYDPDQEIDLHVAYDRLRAAAPEIEPREPTKVVHHQSPEPDGSYDDDDVISALDAIPNNDLPWEAWKEIGAGIIAGMGTSGSAFAAFDDFSRKSGKYSRTGTEAAWRQMIGCPYRNITVGSLFFMAKQADPNWISPSFRRKINPPPTQRELEWTEQARETAEYIREIRTGAYRKSANIYSEDEVDMSDTHFDRTHELIDELARLDRTEFYTRLAEAAQELGWKEERVEDCVKDRRRTLRDEAKRAANSPGEGVERRLNIGSDMEIADQVYADMMAAGQFVHTEGSFYEWTPRVWAELDDADVIERFLKPYDGSYYSERARVKLDKSKVRSIMSFLTHRLRIKDFFADAKIGINLQNGFIEFMPDGSFTLVPHRPDQKARVVLPGAYDKNFTSLPENSMLFRFFETTFKDDPEKREKIMLLQEVAGSALLGNHRKWLPQPKAIIMHGRKANNGKSQYTDMLEGLVGSSSHVPPQHFDNPNAAIAMRGQTLNTARELTSAETIASNVFKECITGEPMVGKILYRDICSFRPMAQLVFSTQRLPPIAGGIDRGCRRRLVVVEFNRVIPNSEMIPDIGTKILKREYQLLLSFAIEGACRLIRQQAFTIPQSSIDALDGWIVDADPVTAWRMERVRETQDKPGDPGYKPSDVYDMFHTWAMVNHYSSRTLPKPPEFRERMAEVYPGCKRTAKGNRFKGIVILSSDPADLADELAQPPTLSETAVSTLNDDLINGMTDAYPNGGLFR